MTLANLVTAYIYRIIPVYVEFRQKRGDAMLAEINHKFRCNQEDELTGNFFGSIETLSKR